MSEIIAILHKKAEYSFIKRKIFDMKVNSKINTLISQADINELMKLKANDLSLLNKEQKEAVFLRFLDEFNHKQPEEENRRLINPYLLSSVIYFNDKELFKRFLDQITTNQHYTMYDLNMLAKIISETKDKELIQNYYEMVQPFIFDYENSIKNSKQVHPYFTFDKKLETKPDSHEHTTSREEYQRHSLIFDSLEYLDVKTVIDKWEDMETLCYGIRQFNDFSAKTELFWYLNVHQRFPEAYQYLVNSSAKNYLLCSTSYTEKVHKEPQKILFMHHDFKNFDASFSYLEDLNKIQKYQKKNNTEREKNDNEYLFTELRSINRKIDINSLPNFIDCYIRSPLTENKNYCNYIPKDNIFDADKLILSDDFFQASIDKFSQKLNKSTLPLMRESMNIMIIMTRWTENLSCDSLKNILPHAKKYNYTLPYLLTNNQIAFADITIPYEDKRNIMNNVYQYTQDIRTVSKFIKTPKTGTMSDLTDEEKADYFAQILHIVIGIATTNKKYPQKAFIEGIGQGLSYAENQRDFIDSLLEDFDIDSKVVLRYLKILNKKYPEYSVLEEIQAKYQKDILNESINIQTEYKTSHKQRL